MTLDFPTDLFFNTSEFATPAQVTQGARSKSINVIFDRSYIPNPFGETVSEDLEITAYCPVSAFQGFRHGAVMQVRGVTYEVTGNRLDADGECTELLLREVDAIALPPADSTPIPEEENLVQVSFSWGDVSPVQVWVAPANALIVTVTVNILVPFNAPAGLSVGDAGNPNRLFPGGMIDAMDTAEFEWNPQHRYLSSTPVLLSIQQNGATQGSGIVYLEWR
jgi:hypothetical protein